MPTNVLFLTLDGADPTLLRKWSNEGYLPTIRRLLQSWYSADVGSLPGLGDGAFWATVHTGCGPGSHGHYFPAQFSPGDYATRKFDFDSEFKRDPFWLFASKFGKRVGILDLFTAPLVTGLDGVQVADWMIRDRTGPPRSWPQPLMAALTDKFSADPVPDYTGVRPQTESAHADFHARFTRRTRVKTEAVVGMLASNQWDLYAINFSEAHDLAHEYWHWHDPDDQNYPAGWVKNCGDPLLKCYQELDQAIEQVITASSAQTIFFLAGLGMTSQVTANPVLDQALGQLSGHTGSRAALREQWPVRPYFAVQHNMNAGAVRINLKGRERSGTIEPAQYEGVCNDLVAQLGEMTAVDTGDRIVEKVVRTRLVYPGDGAEQLPDLMVVWKQTRPFTGVTVPGHPSLLIEPTNEVESRTGDHNQQAMIICNRPFVDKGGGQPSCVPAESIAPTIGRSLGVRFPGMEAAPYMLG